MQPNNFSKKIFKIHAVQIRESHNLLFEFALTSEQSDKLKLLPKDITSGLGLPSNIKTMYDYRMNFYGSYDRLFQFCVISLCSEIEFFFKSLYNHYKFQIPASEKSGNFYQRFLKVIDALKNEGVDFSSIIRDVDNVNLAFQIRHIAIHNMGLVDSEFMNKTKQKGVLNQTYSVTQQEYMTMFNSTGVLLQHLDNHLP